MTITKQDYEDMEIGYNRSIRTATSEQYIIYSDNPDAGPEPLAAAAEARVGCFILQYAANTLTRPIVEATLILEADWSDDATSALIKELDASVFS